MLATRRRRRAGAGRRTGAAGRDDHGHVARRAHLRRRALRAVALADLAGGDAGARRGQPRPAATRSSPRAPSGRPTGCRCATFAATSCWSRCASATTRRPVLDEVDLVFEAGRVTALTGPTGVGRARCSTCCCASRSPRSGMVSVGGRDLRMLAVEGVRRHIAYVPQESWFLDDTIRHNIALGAARRLRRGDPVRGRQRPGQCLRRAAAGGPRHRWSGSPACMLSGGERKRLAIARAVVRRADLFLLDEPTAGLDDAAADSCSPPSPPRRRGRTVVVVTHDPRVVRWADDVVHLPTAARASTTPAPPFRPVPTALMQEGGEPHVDHSPLRADLRPRRGAPRREHGAPHAQSQPRSRSRSRSHGRTGATEAHATRGVGANRCAPTRARICTPGTGQEGR